jgi:hypothetical protein
MKVRDKASQANEAVLLIRGIKSQIADRKTKAAGKAALTKALDDFEKALSAVEGEIYQVKLQSSQDPLNFPIKLNNKIAALQGIIESADVRPTEQTYSVFRTLSNRLDEQLTKVDAGVKTTMPPVNQLLQREKLDPVEGGTASRRRRRRLRGRRNSGQVGVNRAGRAGRENTESWRAGGFRRALSQPAPSTLPAPPAPRVISRGETARSSPPCWAGRGSAP